MNASVRANALERALEELRTGRPVLVSDDPEREDEADLVLAASTADAAAVAFLVRHTSGVLCAPMPAGRARVLGLPPMVARNQDPKGTAYTVSCDAVGVGTGIGASERALTLQVLADPTATPESITRPGHVFPLVARERGLAVRRGHTEAAVALTRLAGLGDVGVIAELVGDDGEVLRGTDVADFAERHGLVHLGLDEIAAQEAGLAAAWTPWALLPTAHGEFSVRVREGQGSDVVWVQSATRTSAPVGVTPAEAPAPLVRLHSECLTSESLGSLRCDCAEQLEEALAAVGERDAILLYLRGHEGRGIGLADKIRAYALQDSGSDTVEANLALGRAADERDYAAAAAALAERGIHRVRLLSNNPAKASALAGAGIAVESMIPTVAVTREQAREYLRVKGERMGHLFGPRNPGAEGIVGGAA